MMFLYRVRDHHGRVKTGRFEAANRQAAAQRFQSQGWTIEELTAEAPKAKAPSQEFQAPAPSPRRRPVARTKPPWTMVAVALVVVGALWGVADWWRATRQTSEKIQEHRWKLRVNGQLPKDAQQIRLSFPELPLQLDRQRQQMDSQGRFNIEMDLTSLREPTIGEAYLGERKVTLERSSTADGPVFKLAKP